VKSQNVGKPCGESWIAAWKMCIKGVGIDHEIFRNMGSSPTEQLQKALTDFHDNLVKHIPEEAHKNWERAVFDLLKTFKDFPMDPEQKETFLEKKLLKQLKEGERMMVNQPRYLNINGTKIEAPTDLLPKLGAAQSGWYDPRLNLAFNAKGVGNNGIASVKLQSGGGSQTELHLTGQLSSMLNYRAKQLAEGKSWPSEPTKTPTQAEIDKVYSEVKGKEIWKVGGNLMDTSRKRNELLEYYEIANKNPSPEVQARREFKSKAMIAAWLAYDKKSPVTGLQVDLTPSIPQGGKYRSTVDHKVPLDELRKKLTSVTDPNEKLKRLIQSSDTKENFYIVEGGLNAMKNKNTWSDIVKGADPDIWVASVFQSLKKSPPVMGLNQKAFEERFGSSSNFKDPVIRNQLAKSFESERINRVLNGEVLQNIKTPTVAPKTPKVRAVRAVRSPRQTLEGRADKLLNEIRNTPTNKTTVPKKDAATREVALIAQATTLANNMKQKGLKPMQVKYELKKLKFSNDIIEKIKV